MDSSCSFFSGMSVLTLALCARLSWLLVSFQVHMKSLHIIIIIINLHDIVFTESKTTCKLWVRRIWFDILSVCKLGNRLYQCIMYNVQCTVYNVQCTMYNVQCTMYNVLCTLYSVQCTMYYVQCTVYSVQCTMYYVQCTVYSVQCTMYNVQCTVYSVQCTMYNVQYTMYAMKYRRKRTALLIVVSISLLYLAVRLCWNLETRWDTDGGKYCT